MSSSAWNKEIETFWHVRQGQLYSAEVVMGRMDTARLSVLRRDAIRLAELITGEINRREGDEHIPEQEKL
jgi:hypothetical protein